MHLYDRDKTNDRKSCVISLYVTALFNPLGIFKVQMKSLNISVNHSTWFLLSIGEVGFFNYIVLVNNIFLFFFFKACWLQTSSGNSLELFFYLLFSSFTTYHKE